MSYWIVILFILKRNTLFFFYYLGRNRISFIFFRTESHSWRITSGSSRTGFWKEQSWRQRLEEFGETADKFHEFPLLSERGEGNPQTETEADLLSSLLGPRTPLSHASPFLVEGCCEQDIDHDRQVQWCGRLCLSALDVSCVTMFHSAWGHRGRLLTGTGIVSSDRWGPSVGVCAISVLMAMISNLQIKEHTNLKKKKKLWRVPNISFDPKLSLLC